MSRISENFTIDEVFRIFNRSPYPHQSETIRSILDGKSVVLRAPCGSGKTEACYISFILGRDKLPDRLIYSLPTRALSDEIAKRIKNDIDKMVLPYSVLPQHGASSKDPFFRSDIIVSTIDQTVGAYCCTPLSLPVHLGNIPAGAAVSGFHCFDEAHTYDRFLGLQSMLVLVERSKALGIPFLIMSATLPDSFVRWFQNKFGEEFVNIVEGKDTDVKSRRERHVVLYWKDKQLGIEDVFHGADSSKKMMIVCNTVERAQTLYKQVCKSLKEKGFQIFLLHSRFLDEDRKRIEESMRRSLGDPEVKTCLITTQVCEVGLDISCDLLLTELAPADALIQRMGRCARKSKQGEVWIFDVEYDAPYNTNEMIKSRIYISQELESKRVGWKEELDFVNALLGEDFERIMNDEQRRYVILKGLGDAAFKGRKKDLEKNVRDMLNANITIHDNPDSFDFHELLRMPWLDVDIRILKRHLVKKAKFWRADFGHDENGVSSLRFLAEEDIFPYEFYVVHPDSIRYTTDCGLFFGERGENFAPINTKPDPKPSLKYETEFWIDHARNALNAFEERVKDKESYALKLLNKLLRKNNLTQTVGLVALSIVVHDLGKLNMDWQERVYATEKPLAHTSTHFKGLPPHATVSAYSMSRLFRELINNEIYALAFELAIGHHHHTRAENVPKYRLGWRELYTSLIKEISEKYDLNINPNITEKIETPAKLDAAFFDFERKNQYTAYCIISRLIRLSDQASFEPDRDACQAL